MAVFSETDFPYGNPISGVPLANDVSITKLYPGVDYNGLEASNEYCETREVSGDFWSAVNATFNTGTLMWQQVNGAFPSTATVQRGSAGTTQYLTATASGISGSNISWSTTATISNPTGALTLTGLMQSATAKLTGLAGSGVRILTTDNSGNIGALSGAASTGQGVQAITYTETGSESNGTPGVMATLNITTPTTSTGPNMNYRLFVQVFITASANASVSTTTAIGIGNNNSPTSGVSVYANGNGTHLISGGNLCIRCTTYGG